MSSVKGKNPYFNGLFSGYASFFIRIIDFFMFYAIIAVVTNDSRFVLCHKDCDILALWRNHGNDHA